jgi:hypothetical protein
MPVVDGSGKAEEPTGTGIPVAMPEPVGVGVLDPVGAGLTVLEPKLVGSPLLPQAAIAAAPAVEAAIPARRRRREGLNALFGGVVFIAHSKKVVR